MENKRNTIQRQIIFNAVRELDIHATAEQVVEHVAKEYPAIGRATVYRNLGRMAEAGELANIGTFNGSAHYDHNLHEHYHFICDECGQVFDINCYFEGICDQIPDMEGFEIRKHNLNFSGLCKNCNSKKGI